MYTWLHPKCLLKLTVSMNWFRTNFCKRLLHLLETFFYVVFFYLLIRARKYTWNVNRVVHMHTYWYPKLKKVCKVKEELKRSPVPWWRERWKPHRQTWRRPEPWCRRLWGGSWTRSRTGRSGPSGNWPPEWFWQPGRDCPGRKGPTTCTSPHMSVSRP